MCIACRMYVVCASAEMRTVWSDRRWGRWVWSRPLSLNLCFWQETWSNTVFLPRLAVKSSLYSFSQRIWNISFLPSFLCFLVCVLVWCCECVCVVSVCVCCKCVCVCVCDCDCWVLGCANRIHWWPVRLLIDWGGYRHWMLVDEFSKFLLSDAPRCSWPPLALIAFQGHAARQLAGKGRWTLLGFT